MRKPTFFNAVMLVLAMAAAVTGSHFVAKALFL